MKHFTNQSYESHVGRMNYGGAKFCRFALFPLMLLMLLLLPTRMVAQTDYDTSVTLTALAVTLKGTKVRHTLISLMAKKNPIISLSGAASLMAVPTSSSKPARQECLWVTPSQRVMTMQILDVEVAIRCHGSSMATMKAKKANGCLSRR